MITILFYLLLAFMAFGLICAFYSYIDDNLEDILKNIIVWICLIIIFIPRTLYKLLKKLFSSRNETINEVTTINQPSYILNVKETKYVDYVRLDYNVCIQLTLDETNITIDRIVIYNHQSHSDFTVSTNGINCVVKLPYLVDIERVYKKLNECSSFDDIKNIK
ncbi:MAG: hypothetical protein RR620_08715 [Clostridium sp.]